ETSTDGIGFVGLNGKFEEVNEALIKTFGYTLDEFKSMRFQDITPKKWHKMEEEIITNQILKRGYSDVYEKEAIRKDGTTIPVAIRAWLVRNGKDNPKRMMGILRDITDRKEFERKLKESEEKYRTLTEQALMGIAIAQNNKIKYMNDTYSKICGYTIKEMEQWTIEDLKKILHPDDYDFILDQFQKKQRGDIDIINNYQYRVFKKNGEMVWVDNYSKSIIYEGKPADYITVLDITDRKKAEEALIRSKEKYRKISERYETLLDSITDIVYVINREWEFTFFNKLAEKVFNIVIENILGRKLTDMDPDIEQTSFFKMFQSVMNTRKPGQVRDKYTFPNSSTRCYEVRVYPISEGILCFARDITEEIKAEQKLKESEEKFRTIADQSLLGIGIIQDNFIKYVNKRFADMLGYTINEIVSWSTEEFIKTVHLEDRDFVAKQIRKKQQGLEDYLSNYQFRAIKKTGEIIWIENFTNSIKYEERSADLVTFIDITEKKEVEKELIELNKLKTELLRRTSHELKTPLISIKGFTGLLLNLHSEKFDTDTISILNEINQGCVRLENIVNNILKSSHLESGQIKLHPTKENISFLIKFCVNQFRGLLMSRNISIFLNIHDNMHILIEKEKIYDVISNLLTNAVKNTPPGGVIKVQSEIKENFFIISIEDTGIGITKQEKKRLFKQFGKIERYGRGWDIGIEGTGLGLFISKKIVELHGGKIWVESEGRNKGSTFYFSLPIIED
ncbi:MAG: PAS domain S-box protein, partial [Promethearchaeota archaeon]